MNPLRYFILLAALVVTSCTKDIVVGHSVTFVSYTDEEYDELTEVLDLPRYFDEYQAQRPRAAATKATLGRVLFYDANLSEDGTVSCASCHKQAYAFADNVALSKGIYGRQTDRNSLALGVFSSFAEHYGSNGHPGESALFWDTRAADVHSQIVETMANEKEMGMRMDEVIDRLQGERHYEILFDKAFGTTKVEKDHVLIALENFMQAMSTTNSKFDRAREGLLGANTGISQQVFNETEFKGFALFKTNCESCHASSVGTQFVPGGKQFANNGLDAVTTDMGRRKVTSVEDDDAVFKVPSLRNIALTAPYMHDGRFNTLEEVVNFYSEEIQAHPNLDPLLRNENGLPKKMQFTEEDKKALLEFLHTLTDMTELGHKKFSDPWL